MWLFFSRPYLRQTCILVWYVTRKEVAWRAHNLNGIKFHFTCFFHGWPPNRMTSNIKVICSTCPVPILVLLTNIEYVISYKILDTSHTNSRVMSQPCNWERQKEKICLGWIICDETTFHKDLLEVTFTCIITPRFRIHRQKCICKGIIFPVRINIYLKAPFHFFIVFQKDMSIMEHLVVIDMISWTIKTNSFQILKLKTWKLTETFSNLPLTHPCQKLFLLTYSGEHLWEVPHPTINS